MAERGTGDVEAPEETLAGAVARPLTLEEAAERHGAYRWIEQRLFALTGEWSARPGVPPAARLHLFEASAQHAWHAELWAERLPVLAQMDPDALTRPLGTAAGPLLAALEPSAPSAPDAKGDALEPGVLARLEAARFLAGLHRVVLPALLASYGRHRERLSPVADGPSLRALAFVVSDEEAEVRVGEEIVRELAQARADGLADAADEAVRRLDALLDGTVGDVVPWEHEE